jgi:CRP/FNR family cyclic AMP-dependent transcriptional regulator
MALSALVKIDLSGDDTLAGKGPVSSMVTLPRGDTASSARARTQELFAVEIRGVGVTLTQTARLVVPGGAALDLSSPEQAEFARLSLQAVARQHLRRDEDLRALVERITAMLQASTRRSRGPAKLDAGLHLVRAIAMAELLEQDARADAADGPLARGAVESLARGFAARLGVLLPEQAELLFPAFAAMLRRAQNPVVRSVESAPDNESAARFEDSEPGSGRLEQHPVAKAEWPGRPARRGRTFPAPAGGPVSALLLRQISLFRYLTDEHLEQLAAVVTRHKFARDSIVVRAGEAADRMYLVIGGRFKVALGDDQGREVILGILGAGDAFGEMSLIDDAPRSASVTSLEPCEVLVLGRSTFRRFLEADFMLCLSVMRCLIDRVRHANQQIGGLAMLDVRGRVARTLQDLAVTKHGQRIIERVSRQDIAKMIGASREMVSRVMRALEANGTIERRGATLLIRESLAEDRPPARRVRSAKGAVRARS